MESARWYFHKNGKWNNDPEGAEIRLDTSSRSKKVFQVDSRFFVPDGRGGWRNVEEKTSRPGAERGWIWTSWISAAFGKRFFAFEGIRYVDEEIKRELLQGLDVHSEEGEPLRDALEAGKSFLLSKDDAQIFAQRVKRSKGEILRGDIVPDNATESLQEIEQALASIQALAALDQKTMNEVANQDFSNLPEFDARSGQYEAHYEKSRKAWKDCRKYVKSLAAPGKSLAEQTAAADILAKAKKSFEAAAIVREQRFAFEREIADRQKESIQDDPAKEASNQLMLAQLARMANDSGHQAEQAKGQVRIKVDGGWIYLGRTFDFKED